MKGEKMARLDNNQEDVVVQQINVEEFYLRNKTYNALKCLGPAQHS